MRFCVCGHLRADYTSYMYLSRCPECLPDENVNKVQFAVLRIGSEGIIQTFEHKVKTDIFVEKAPL